MAMLGGRIETTIMTQGRHATRDPGVIRSLKRRACTLLVSWLSRSTALGADELVLVARRRQLSLPRTGPSKSCSTASSLRPRRLMSTGTLHAVSRGRSGIVSVVGKVVRQVLFAVLLSILVGQILFGVLFAVVVRQILLAVLFAVGVGYGLIAATGECTRRGSAKVMAEH
jgi:hypothetical protein